MKTAESMVSEVRTRPVASGSNCLVAFASYRHGGVVLNDIAIRQSVDGCLSLTHPRRVAGTDVALGRQRVWPHGPSLRSMERML